MKVTYRRDNVLARRKFLVPVALVIIGVLMLSYGPLRNVVSRAVYSTAPEIWELGGIVGNSWGAFWSEFRLKRALVHENKVLQEEVALMQVRVLDRNLLEGRIRELDEKLGRADGDDRVSARVLSGAGQNPYDMLVIDVGTRQGVLVGDQVVYTGAGIIGTVVEAYTTSAKVSLFSSPNKETMVVFAGQAIPATARGRGMGNFDAKVPQESLIVLGENVLIPGKDMILGVVGAIEKTPSEPFMKVFFRTPFNIATIRSVEVIKSKKQ